MNLLQKILALRKGQPGPAEFPYATERCPGAQVPERLHELRQPGQWPILIGDDEALRWHAAALHAGGPGVDALVSRSRSVDLDALRLSHVSPEADALRERGIHGAWPVDPVPTQDGLMSHIDFLKHEPYVERILALLPTDEPWQAPAWLNFGGWNGCPPPEVQVAWFHEWQRRHGAVVRAIGADMVEMEVEHPPTTREAALRLAEEHYAYCSEVIDSGDANLEETAAALIGSRWWYFWWD